MKYVTITSMDEKYYNHSGRIMSKSYVANIKSDIPLMIYNEDEFTVKVKNVISMGWDLGNEYQDFQNRWQGNSKIITFSKKAFSIIHAMNNIDCDRLIWMDADVIVNASIPMQLLELITPADVLSTHYGVQHSWPSETDPDRMAFSCETGFFVLNKRHPGFKIFCDTYTQIYVNDLNKNIRRFYDGEVYGETVRILENQGAKMLNLNPGNKHKTPIPRSILSPYISHHKAGLKDSTDFTKIEKEIDDKSKSI